MYTVQLDLYLYIWSSFFLFLPPFPLPFQVPKIKSFFFGFEVDTSLDHVSRLICGRRDVSMETIIYVSLPPLFGVWLFLVLGGGRNDLMEHNDILLFICYLTFTFFELLQAVPTLLCSPSLTLSHFTIFLSKRWKSEEKKRNIET